MKRTPRPPEFAVPNADQFTEECELISERGAALLDYRAKMCKAQQAIPAANVSTVDAPKMAPNTINGKWLHRKMTVADRLAEKPWLVEILKSEGII